MIILHFGTLHQESTTLPSFGLFTSNEGVHRISMDLAAWRCRAGIDLLCSSSSSNCPGGPIELGLSKLQGRNVVGLTLAEVTLDLSVHFAGGLVFDIFCDQVDVEDAHDNYSFRSEHGYFIVGPASRLRFEAHTQ